MVVEQRLLDDEEQRGRDDPEPEGERFDSTEEDSCCDEAGDDQQRRGRLPVERMEQDALHVVGERRAKPAGRPVVGDDRSPELRPRSHMGDRKHGPYGGRTGRDCSGQPPRSPRDEEHRERSGDG